MNKFYRLIYWRTPWKTGLVLTLLLFLEIGLLYRSIISVFAWSGLMVMAYFAILRSYTHFFPVHRRSASQVDFDEDILNLVEGSEANEQEQSRFSAQTEEKLREVLNRLNRMALMLRDMFLITNYLESIKLAVFLYAMTYVGAHFNFLTLVILATVVAFTVPKIYETFQEQIDNALKLAKNKIFQLLNEVQQKLSHMPALQAILPHSQTLSPNAAGDRKKSDNNQYKYH